MITIKKGLDLPISGEPEQIITDAPAVCRVAVLGNDYQGMKPALKVAAGDRVKLGQPLFEDKKNPGVFYTAPGAGRVAEIVRGERRALLAVVIELEGDDEVEFPAVTLDLLQQTSGEAVAQRLLESGLWPALQTRPFGKAPRPGSQPQAIFITAMDTQPLAAEAGVILREKEDDFRFGVEVIRRLTEGTVYICKSPATELKTFAEKQVEIHDFAGCHPAGLAGTHIHFLEPVSAHKTVWSINYQEVIAIGVLFRTGRIDTERIVALGGPSVLKPRLLRTRLGADLCALTAGELREGEQRLISGSVLQGTKADGAAAFLGRYHYQISVLEEGRQREFLGWMAPGLNQFSVKNVFLSRLFPRKRFAFNTGKNGSPRAMVPVGTYEKVMPLDIQPTFLLRSLIVEDTVQAQQLGCLELVEEDLALCTFVCPGKYDYGRILRGNLIKIEKEG